MNFNPVHTRQVLFCHKLLKSVYSLFLSIIHLSKNQKEKYLEILQHGKVGLTDYFKRSLFEWTNHWKSLTAKSTIVDVWLSSEYSSKSSYNWGYEKIAKKKDF